MLDGFCIDCNDESTGVTRDATPNILQVADKLTSGERQNVYGHPLDNYQCVAELWSAMLRQASVITEPHFGVSPELAQAMMIAVKLSRFCRTPDHHDTLVDIAGYARTIEMTTQERKKRNEIESRLPRHAIRTA